MVALIALIGVNVDRAATALHLDGILRDVLGGRMPPAIADIAYQPWMATAGLSVFMAGVGFWVNEFWRRAEAKPRRLSSRTTKRLLLACRILDARKVVEGCDDYMRDFAITTETRSELRSLYADLEEYGFEVPAVWDDHHDRSFLRYHVDYLNAIWPLVRDGKMKAAKAEAARYSQFDG